MQLHGREVRLYLLFEHQSSPDPLMPFRALAYEVRIWKAWLREHEGATRLPPVIAVLLAQVDGGWKSATDLLSIVDFADDAERALLGPYVPQCRLLVDDLAFVTNAELDARPLPNQARLALAALRDVRRSRDITKAVRRWRSWFGGERYIGTLLRYIMSAKPAIDVETLAKIIGAIEPQYEGQVMTTAAELIQQGMDKGRTEGRTEGAALALLKLLRLRFGTVSTEITDRVHAANAATLDRWTDRVLTATTPDEVLAD